MDLYNLNDVALSVARKNESGEKINKLRKSFENYVKDLPGRDKVHRENLELRNLSVFPDEEWHVHKVSGKELSNGLTDSMLAKLEKATNMGAGKLPENEDSKWKSIVESEGQAAKLQPQQPNSSKRPSDAAPQYPATSPTTSEPGRPSRRGTKRRYNDESFEGYGEGYVDDAAESISLDNGDDGDGNLTGKRKRRRVGHPQNYYQQDSVSPSPPAAKRSSTRKTKKRG